MNEKHIQVSIDSDLLARIDADPEATAEGRSAFIRSALRFYLRAKKRSEVDHQVTEAYAAEADAMLAEIEDLIRPRTA